MSNIRIRYAITSALFLSVSAVPLEQATKRQENSSSLEKTIEDAVHLDKDIKAAKDQEADDSDSDDDDDDDANNDSRNRPSISPTISISPTATPTSLTDTLASSTSTTSTTSSTALPATATPSATKSNSGAIAGGTIGGLLLVAIIAFVIFRWRKSKRTDNNTWINEKQAYSYPKPSPSTLFGGSSSQGLGPAPAMPRPPPSTLFGGSSSQRSDPVPAMPKPPPLVFTNERSPFRDPDENEANAEHRTFYLESESNRGSRLPPVYEELKSPGMQSSISQIEPYPEKAGVRKVYASFVPPPIPETRPEARDPMMSRFSWTTKRSSGDSEPMFRTVQSWVSHQAGRPNVKERLAQLGLEEGAPPTPVEFRFHPGAPVSFTAGHGRMESEDLDRQMRAVR